MKLSLGWLGISAGVLLVGMYMPSAVAEEVKAEKVQALSVTLEVDRESNGINVRIAKSGDDQEQKKLDNEGVESARSWRFELSEPNQQKTLAIINIEIEGFEIEDKQQQSGIERQQQWIDQWFEQQRLQRNDALETTPKDD